MKHDVLFFSRTMMIICQQREKCNPFLKFFDTILGLIFGLSYWLPGGTW
jgi:hypothetical protein